MLDVITEVKTEITELAKLLDVSPTAALDYVDRNEAQLKDFYENGMRISDIADFVVEGL